MGPLYKYKTKNFFKSFALLIIVVLINSLANYSRGQCTHTIRLTDTYGDGWNGGTVSVSVNGTVVQNNITIASGFGPVDFTFTATTGQTIRVYQTAAGSYPGEMRVQILNNAGTSLLGPLQPVAGTATTGGSTVSASCAVAPAGDNCSNAQNLGSLTSPYSATTVGYANDISVCRTGYPDRIFYLDVPNCNTVNIWQSVNSYDSYHYMGYGATCPGATQLYCVDDPDDQANTWTNNTGSTQRVWFIVDGFSGSGTFTLNWTLTCTTPAQPSVISGTTNPEPGTSQVYSVTNVAGVTYAWSFPSGWTITGGQGTSSVTVTVGTTNGNIQVTPSNCCGNGTARTLATNIPAYRWKYISSNTGATTWCAGESRSISITIKNTGTATWNTTYTTNVGVKWNGWSDYHVRVSTGSLAPNTQTTYNLTIQAKDATAGPVYGADLAAGSNNLTFDLVNEGNCWFAGNGGACGPGNVVFTSAAQTIQSNSIAPTSITGNTTIGAGASTTLTATGGTLGTGAVVQWYTGSCAGTLVGTGASISVSPSSTTTYFVRYSGTCNSTGCVSTTVTVYPSVNIPAAGNNTVTCGTNTVLYDNGGSAGSYADLSNGYTVLSNSGTGVITLSGTLQRY